MTTLKKLLRITVNFLTWGILIFAVLLYALAVLAQRGDGAVASVCGRCVFTVQSSSMEPVIRRGDLIVVRTLSDAEKASLGEGDIVSFYVDLDGDGDREINTHRIVAVEEDSGETRYITKGENNPSADAEPIAAGQVIGRYCGIRLGGVGKLITFLQSPVGFFYFIFSPLCLFALIAAGYFIKVLYDVVRGGAEEKAGK